MTQFHSLLFTRSTTFAYQEDIAPWFKKLKSTSCISYLGNAWACASALTVNNETALVFLQIDDTVLRSRSG